MPGRLLALAAVLLLASASAGVSAYAERLPTSGERLSLPKNALPARASAPAVASSAKPDASVCRIEEICRPPLKCASGVQEYLYAFSNPGRWRDPDGRQSIEINVTSCSEEGRCTTEPTSGAALPFLSPSQMATPEQADALIEAQARMRLFGLGRSDAPMVVQPMLASGAGQFRRPYVEYGSSRQLSLMQSSAELDQALGFDPNYNAIGTTTESAGRMLMHSLPPVAVAHGIHGMATAENGWQIAGGALEATLGALPAALIVRGEVAALRAESATIRSESALARQQGRPAIVIENPAGVSASSQQWGKQPEIFKTETNWTAPSSGTGQTYRVYQREIDWALEVRGRTNLERARAGEAPYVLRDGQPQQVQLHHSRQDARGSLFELGDATHLRVRTGHGREALHPYGRRQHPDYPVNRQLFERDRRQYWQDRVGDIE